MDFGEGNTQGSSAAARFSILIKIFRYPFSLFTEYQSHNAKSNSRDIMTESQLRKKHRLGL